MAKRRYAFFLIIILLFILSPFPSHGQELSSVVEKVIRSIVVIVGSTSDKAARGSGFFVTSQGDILTNFHVIENMESIAVRLHNKDIYPAQIRTFDKERDMALLATNLPSNAFSVIPLATTTPKIGTTVLAIGASKGLEQSVSDGVVSSLRTFRKTQHLQISCPLSRGSSGGPIISLQGEVVGMSAFALSQGVNLNFAVPSTTLKHFVEYAKKMPPIQTRANQHKEKSTSMPSPRKNSKQPEKRYVFIGTTNLGEKTFIDSQSIVKNGNTYEFWYIHALTSTSPRVKEFSTNKGRADRLEIFTQTDCAKRRYRTLKVIVRSTHGDILRSLTDNNASWEKIYPNTIGVPICEYLKKHTP